MCLLSYLLTTGSPTLPATSSLLSWLGLLLWLLAGLGLLIIVGAEVQRIHKTGWPAMLWKSATRRKKPELTLFTRVTSRGIGPLPAEALRAMGFDRVQSRIPQTSESAGYAFGHRVGILPARRQT
jgi:hypothetical protein